MKSFSTLSTHIIARVSHARRLRIAFEAMETYCAEAARAMTYAEDIVDHKQMYPNDDGGDGLLRYMELNHREAVAAAERARGNVPALWLAAMDMSALINQPNLMTVAK